MPTIYVHAVDSAKSWSRDYALCVTSSHSGSDFECEFRARRIRVRGKTSHTKSFSEIIHSSPVPMRCMSTDEIHAYDMHAHEIHAYEMHAYETHAHEIQAHTCLSLSRATPRPAPIHSECLRQCVTALPSNRKLRLRLGQLTFSQLQSYVRHAISSRGIVVGGTR